MKRITFTSFFLFLFTITGLGQTTGRITGTVVFAGDKSVIHGASVIVEELKRSINSDDDGNFVFTDIPPGTYTVHAHLEGFSDESKRVTVTARGT